MKLRRRSSIGSIASSQRGVVDEALEERGRLRPAGAAVGAHRRGVGDGHGDVELDGREAVRAVGHPLGARREERADRRIGAGVADQPHPQPGERAVGCRAELGVLDLAPAVGERHEVVAAGGMPRHRPADMASGGGHGRVLGADPGLAAEATADLRGDHVDRALGQAQRLRQLADEGVGHLGRGVEREGAVLAGDGGAAVGLHRDDGDALVDVAAAHDDLAVVAQLDGLGSGVDQGLVRAVVGEDHRRRCRRGRPPGR